MILNQFSPFVQRLIAISIGIITMLLAIEWVVAPVYSTIVSEHANLAALREHRSFLASAQRWPDHIFGPTIDRRLLVHGTGASTAHTLHSAIIEIATRLGVSTNSIQIVEQKNGNARRFSIRAEINGPHDSILKFLAEIERGRPMLRVQQLTLEPAINREGALTAQVTLRGYGAVTP